MSYINPSNHSVKGYSIGCPVQDLDSGILLFEEALFANFVVGGEHDILVIEELGGSQMIDEFDFFGGQIAWRRRRFQSSKFEHSDHERFCGFVVKLGHKVIALNQHVADRSAVSIIVVDGGDRPNKDVRIGGVVDDIELIHGGVDGGQ